MIKVDKQLPVVTALDPQARRPVQGEQTALRTRIRLANAVVIAVKQMAEQRVKFLIIRTVGFKQKGFEEPAGVGQMPLQRTGEFSGLQLVVGGIQRLAQSECLCPDLLVKLHLLSSMTRTGQTLT